MKIARLRDCSRDGTYTVEDERSGAAVSQNRKIGISVSPSFANWADQGVDGEAPQAAQASGSGPDTRLGNS